MDAYRWRYELLLETMNKIAKTGNKEAIEAVDKVKRKCKPFNERKQQMLDLLEDGPMELCEIQEGMGSKATTIDKVLTALRLEKKIYLHSFKAVGRNSIIRKVWAAGNQEDAVYIPKAKKSRAKIKKQVVEVVKKKVFIDPMISAFFGSPR